MSPSELDAPNRLETRTFTDFLASQSGDLPDKHPLFDVVIVGSGYGGSAAVHVLANAAEKSGRKLNVLMLERGKAFHPGDFPSRFAELPRELRLARQDTGQVSGHEGLFDLRMGADVAALVANGVGGGSLINAGVMIDPNPDDVREVGREPILKPRLASLLKAGVFRRARRLLGGEVLREGQWVRNNVDRLPKELRKLKAFREIAGRRGSTADAVDITIGLDGGPNHAGTRLSPCIACGDCMTGCNAGAKDSHDRNLLLEAQRRQYVVLDVVTGATVSSVVREHGHWELRVLHTDPNLQAREATGFRVRTQRVVLAAGALGSPEILLRSRSDRLVLSPTLGESFSGNGDDIAAIHRLDQPVHSAADEDMPPDRRRVGPTTTARVEMKGLERPFLLEEFSVPGPMRHLFEEVVTTGYTVSRLPAADLASHGPKDRDPLAVDPQAMLRTLLVGVIGHDDARGSLRLSRPERQRGDVPQMGTLRIHWPDARWGREMDAAHDELRAYAERRGTMPGIAQPTLVANPMWRLLPPGLDSLVSQPRGPVLTVHPLGGCRMGLDSLQGVVDACGRVHDAVPSRADPDGRDPWFGSLVVLDGSIIGASLGVNPALTITSLALAAMDELLATDAHWKPLGPAGAADDPPTRVDEPALPAKERMVPAMPEPPGPDPVPPVRTELEIVERLVSAPLLLQGQAAPVIVELTIALQRTSVATLIAPDRVPVGLVPKESRLRIYDANKWEQNALKHLDDHDAQRRKALLFEAELDGSLRFLHRGATQGLCRTVFGLWDWFRNRGKRDLWQKYVEPFWTAQGRERRAAELASRPRNEPSRGFMQELMEFISLASHAGQLRRFDYEMKIGRPLGADQGGLGSLLSAGQVIRGEKRLRYERRCNPWKQLTRMSLTVFPGMTLSAERPEQCPVLKLDARYLAKEGIPLLRVGSQRNHAEALAELLSLGLYLLRVLIDVHLWSFRKPDRREPREPYRLPPPLPAMPAPQITMLAVDKWPKSTPLEGEPVMVRLTRYPLAGRQTGGKPLVMIHGYTASGTTFAHPSVQPSAAAYFWERGRDVWVLDLRTSCGLDTASYPWSMEQPALIDIPSALLHVKNATGQRVDVLAHCIGGAMLGMALLSDADSVRNSTLQLGVDAWLSTEQLGVLTAFNGDRPTGGLHPTVDRVILSQKGPVMRYTDENVFRAYVLQFARRFLLSPDYRFEPSRDPGVAEQLLDRLLASLPYERPDFDLENPCRPCAKTPWTASRHRLDALFGRTFSAVNLRPETLDAIDDFFGPMNLDTVSQTIHFARWDAVTDQRGSGEFVIRRRFRERWGGIPTLVLHGLDNGLVDPYTTRLMEAHLDGTGVQLQVERYAGMGHQDSLIGTGATRVFQRIESFLALPPPLANPQPPLTGPVVQACWLGPRLVMPSAAGQAARVAVMSWPGQGRGTLWLVPAHEHTDGNGKVTGHHPVPPGLVRWIRGETGPSGRWLYAAPDPGTWPVAPAGTRAGWLCLMVYPIDETSARRVDRPMPPPDIAAGPAALAVPVQARVLNGTPGPGTPREDEGPVYAPLAESIPYQGKYSGPFSDFEEPAADVDAALLKAVRQWLQQQTIDTSSEVFVRASDIRRVAELPEAGPLRFAVGSCQYPRGLFDRAVAGASLDGLAECADAVSLALMVGDQIYADATAGLVDPTRRDELYELPHQRAFRVEAMRRVMRRMPLHMLPDDHELFDNWQRLPANLPSDKGNPRLKRLRRRVAEARRHGVAAFRRFQRTGESAPYTLDLSFDAGGNAFYLLDTRTRRRRGKPSEARAHGAIVSRAQQARLEAWLVKPENAERVKFIVTPSLFLPRRVQSATSLADACRSDAWDGFPESMRWLLGFIEKNNVSKIVFLSGDEHHSLHSEFWVGKDRIKVVSVHSSALYAPYPFANGRPRDLQEQETHSDYGTSVQVETTFAPRGDGFVVLGVVDGNGGPRLSIEYRKADRSAPYLVEVALL